MELECACAAAVHAAMAPYDFLFGLLVLRFGFAKSLLGVAYHRQSGKRRRSPYELAAGNVISRM